MIPSLSLSVKNQIVGAKIATHDKTAFADLSTTSTVVDRRKKGTVVDERKDGCHVVDIHSQSKCLVCVKKCCHVWLDQNFDPSLLTNKL